MEACQEKTCWGTLVVGGLAMAPREGGGAPAAPVGTPAPSKSEKQSGSPPPGRDANRGRGGAGGQAV
jgi:hypothetical protein